jgi:type I site-specific restriction endonuclease
VSNTSKAETRKGLIDSRLAVAGWSAECANLIEEYRVVDSSNSSEDNEPHSESYEYIDYLLLGRDSRPIAIYALCVGGQG